MEPRLGGEIGVGTEEMRAAAERLHSYLRDRHWTGSHLEGPDPGIRFNSRIYRFVKNYTPFITWKDDLVYAQAQKYWIAANWLMVDLDLGDVDGHRKVAVATAHYLADVQQPDGHWEYPNPEWRGRVATVEGNYATIGMLLTHEREPDERLLEGAKRWYDHAVNRIGFQVRGDEYAINYFGNVPGGRVPNNSASAIRAFAMVAEAAGDERYLRFCPPMIRFMASSQMESGELPYAVEGVTGGSRPHFLCYQYNAFEFLNILGYLRITGDESVRPILERLVPYLERGLTPEGHGRYDCETDRPEVVYYTAAIATALREAKEAGFGADTSLVGPAFRQVLGRQHEDGSFPYSFGNYGVLEDRRPYPRYLSMILTHLLQQVAIDRDVDRPL